jgi:hypothetical protein
MDTRFNFKKADDELQVLWTEVYAPGIPDSQGDFMTASEIRDMAYSFMKLSKMDNVDLNHNHRLSGIIVVESFVAREDDSIFIPFAWVVGLHVPDVNLWEAIKRGDYNGVSLDGDAERADKTVTLTVPDRLAGKTTKAENHEHTFLVKYGPQGQFLGGDTDEVNGHSHRIQRGTVTEAAHGHSHRFSFVEQLHADHAG